MIKPYWSTKKYSKKIVKKYFVTKNKWSKILQNKYVIFFTINFKSIVKVLFWSSRIFGKNI